MKKTLLIITVSAGVLFASCGDTKTKSVDTQTAEETAVVTETSVTYTVNIDESTMGWKGSKFLGSFPNRCHVPAAYIIYNNIFFLTCKHVILSQFLFFE